MPEKVWHYEILLLYCSGLRPKDVIDLGFSRSSAYRWHAIWRKAGQRLKKVIGHIEKGSSEREY